MTHAALLKRINDAYHSKVAGAFQPYIGDLLTLANAQAADIKELVACLRDAKEHLDLYAPPMDKIDALLERIGHE